MSPDLPIVFPPAAPRCFGAMSHLQSSTIAMSKVIGKKEIAILERNPNYWRPGIPKTDALIVYGPNNPIIAVHQRIAGNSFSGSGYLLNLKDIEIGRTR